MEVDQRLLLVKAALYHLKNESPVWTRNFKVYQDMGDNGRAEWWQQMSEQGMPMYRTLVAKVIQLRMS